METWLQGMDGFSYCMEMLAAALCFFIFLKKRKGFWLRVGASAIMLFLASLLIYPYFVDITNIYNWIWFIFIFALTIVICYFCCDITWKDAILAASCGALLQHTASSLFIVIFYQGVIPEFSGIRYWGLYVCVYLIGTILIARKLPDEGHYHVSRANAAIMAVTVLTIVLVLSVLVKSTTIDVIGVGTANKEYIKLFRLNQIYALGACVLVLALETILQRELCILPPGLKHSISVTDESIVVNILIRSEVMQKTLTSLVAGNHILFDFFIYTLYENTMPNYICFNTEKSETIRNLIMDMMLELCEDRMYSQKVIHLMLGLFFTYLQRDYSHTMRFSSQSGRGIRYVPQIFAYMHEHYPDYLDRGCGTAFSYQPFLSGPHF